MICFVLFFSWNSSDRNTALSYARDHELIYDRDDKIHLKSEIEYVNVCYPRKLEKEIKGYITHVS